MSAKIDLQQAQDWPGREGAVVDSFSARRLPRPSRGLNARPATERNACDHQDKFLRMP
jgi:hypothetical protein